MSRLLAGLLTLVLCCMQAAWSHDLPVNQMVNAIVQVQGRQADLIARVPMDLLRGIPFPTRDGRYDLSNAPASVDLANLLLADAFMLAENGARLTPVRTEGRLVAASDRTFDRFDHAVAALRLPVDTSTPMPDDSGYLVVHLTYPVASARDRFEIQSQVAVDVGVLAPLTVRFERAGDPVRALIIPGGSDPVDLDPVWWRAAGGFVVLGIEHILSGTDHLLFLLCLVIPVRRLRDIVPVVTAFTLAHSVTLIASALGIAPRGAWFSPLVEAAIAASIVYTALENIVRPDANRRWLISSLFGLVHGFGFSNALGDSLQFAGRHLIVSLLAFNVGIETGQLGVLCVGLPMLAMLRRWFSTRRVVIVLSAFGAGMGGLWLFERWQVLRGFDKSCAAAFCLDNALAWSALAASIASSAFLVVAHVKSRTAQVPMSRRSLHEL